MAQKASPGPAEEPVSPVDITSVLKMKSIDLFLPQAAQLIEPEKICISCQPSQTGP